MGVNKQRLSTKTNKQWLTGKKVNKAGLTKQGLKQKERS